jgi:Asp-tRNA(Asn)/Glu-tRNA(Gln) amidotransferase C subunit
MPPADHSISAVTSRFLQCWKPFLLCLLLLIAGSPVAHAQIAAVASEPKKEPRLSKQETKELFHSLKSILEFVHNDTNFPIRHPVKHEMTNRDKVSEWLAERMRDEKVSERFDSAELMLKKLGLLPRDFDLRAFYPELMREQVAGFYNSKNQTMYLVDWMPLDQQHPVMAHELTHALQDQSFDLEKWMKAGREDDEKKTKPEDLDSGLDAIARDEEEVARHALVEGQGMAVMLNYMLAPSQRNVTNSPVVVETLKQGMLDGAGSPVFQKAPLYIKELLAFPYKSGLTLVQELLIEGGKERAFVTAMRDPPRSTREVMMPKVYLRNEELRPLVLPKLNPILGGHYLRHDVGSFGQFDVDVFLKEFAGEKTANKLAPEWRGGAYYALRKKTEKKRPEPKLKTGDIAFLYLSEWSTAAAAKEFAAVYAATVARRYKFANSEPPGKTADGVHTLPVTRWSTDEGSVLVEQQGTTVLVLESFEPQFIGKLRDAVLAAPPKEVPGLKERRHEAVPN